MSENQPTEQITEPTEDMIAQWKAAYEKVYRVLLADAMYYYRRLGRAEYRHIMKIAGPQAAANMFSIPNPDSNFEIEEQVVQMAILWPKLSPEARAGRPAGVDTSLSTLIMRNSGFDEDAVSEEL